jgi:hypothetical protein
MLSDRYLDAMNDVNALLMCEPLLAKNRLVKVGVSEFLCSRRSKTFPRRRAALATYRPTRWESRSSCYATVFVNLSA